MCGIAGYTGAEEAGLLRRMTDAIRHRGPDAEGFLEHCDIHLGCRRLRVIDLPGGDQPIFNEDRTIGVVYNGEIYNYRELRAELRERGHELSTKSDTECIVHLYEDEGPDCCRRLEGMFAFALLDMRRPESPKLLIARDQVGIKPLVYHWDGRRLVFASEAKSVLLHPSVSAELDADALHQLLNVRFVAAPQTMFLGIRQLPPGHYLTLTNGLLEERRYHQWSFQSHGGSSFDGSREDAAEGFLESLARCLDRQMVADVPLGIFLSGGLDSSALLAGARRAGHSGRLETFTLGFNEPTDELGDAELVARHFDTEHHPTSLSAEPLALFPRIVHHAEMPKVNAAQGYYLSRFARKRVTVALSGLGGDELFLGYDIYRYLEPGRFLVDGPLAPVLALARPLFDGMARLFDRLSGPRGENPRRMIELLASADDPMRYYLTLRNSWDLGDATAGKLYRGGWRSRIGRTTRQALEPYFDRPDLPVVEQVQWAEFRAKMVDDFLLNEDRMSMASSLEVRVPLLDVDMVDFAFSLPLALRFEGRRNKPVMKRALSPLLPPEILRKKKWGFTFNPYEQFRKDLGAVCERELTRSFIEAQGVFRYEFVRRILEAKPSPLLRWHYFMLWQILGLKFWQELFLEGTGYEEIEDRIRRESAA
ncbi:MAG: asparagine synthase (glutamine-hydrolyzing) [Thermoanaerobaculia bacterium]